MLMVMMMTMMMIVMMMVMMTTMVMVMMMMTTTMMMMMIHYDNDSLPTLGHEICRHAKKQREGGEGLGASLQEGVGM